MLLAVRRTFRRPLAARPFGNGVSAAGDTRPAEMVVVPRTARGAGFDVADAPGVALSAFVAVERFAGHQLLDWFRLLVFVYVGHVGSAMPKNRTYRMTMLFATGSGSPAVSAA